MSEKKITITGLVKKGMGKGKETGLKTINLNAEHAQNNNLRKGLYTCVIEFNKQAFQGLVYYGYNSLSKQVCLEAHILNFSENIYNKKVIIKVGKFIRPEIKFDSLIKLKQQLQNDLKIIP